MAVTGAAKVTLVTVFAATVKLNGALAGTPASVAVMLVLPATRAVATPEVLMVATAGLLDASFTAAAGRVWVTPLLVRVTVNCAVPPIMMLGVVVEIAIEGGAVTPETVRLPVFLIVVPVTAAVMVELPVATPVANPVVLPTVTAAVLDEVQVERPVRSAVSPPV
jgi:hypothetical protein